MNPPPRLMVIRSGAVSIFLGVILWSRPLLIAITQVRFTFSATCFSNPLQFRGGASLKTPWSYDCHKLGSEWTLPVWKYLLRKSAYRESLHIILKHTISNKLVSKYLHRRKGIFSLFNLLILKLWPIICLCAVSNLALWFSFKLHSICKIPWLKNNNLVLACAPLMSCVANCTWKKK